MLSAIQMPSFSALQVVFIYLIFHFSPSENHPEFELNHAFACLMNSMVKGGQIIDPSSFMNIFRPLFKKPVEEERGVNADEQEGMYNDFA